MALRKCPQLVLAKPDFALYTRNSKAFIAICRRFAPVVEQVSIDECFLDMTGTGLLYPDPIAIAHTIKDTFFSELGFTVNVGIAPNKLLAKMASDFEKPNKVHTLFADESARLVILQRPIFRVCKSSSASRWESSFAITQTELIPRPCWQSRRPSRATATL